MKSNRIDFKLIIGLVITTCLIFLSFNYSKSFWYLYGASMLFLVSLGIFMVDLRKQLSFVKGILPGVISGIILYIIFYIAAFLLKILPFGLNHFVVSAFHKFTPHSVLIWLILMIAIIPGEEIFWRGFVLKRLANYFTPWIAILLSAILPALMMLFSHNFAVIISIFVAWLFWGMLYNWRPSLLMLYISHLTFAILLLGVFPIYS